MDVRISENEKLRLVYDAFVTLEDPQDGNNPFITVKGIDDDGTKVTEVFDYSQCQIELKAYSMLLKVFNDPTSLIDHLISLTLGAWKHRSNTQVSYDQAWAASNRFNLYVFEPVYNDMRTVTKLQESIDSLIVRLTHDYKCKDIRQEVLKRMANLYVAIVS